MNNAQILVGDAVSRLRELADESIQTCVTSPPYWGLRDYGRNEQLGVEKTPEKFVENLCKVFDEVYRVLANDGTLWVNLGDSYNNKSLAGIPWRFAFALQERGWYLRQDIIWSKPNPMPESVTDRCTKSHEYIFLLTKNAKYYFDNEAIKEPSVTVDDKRNGNGRHTYEGKRAENDGLVQQSFVTINETKNKRSVWTVTTRAYKGAHFAVYPTELITPCVLAGSRVGDTVLDPFSGSGTTGEVALLNGRNYIGVELNLEYARLSEQRITQAIGMLGTVGIYE
jgi:DNA modification methylase